MAWGRGVRVLSGKLRSCPVACERHGWVSRKTRWLVIRDGLAECIHSLPLSERALEAALQEAWAVACDRVEGCEAEAGGEWLIPS